jgi:hypothetical protein
MVPREDKLCSRDGVDILLFGFQKPDDDPRDACAPSETDFAICKKPPTQSPAAKALRHWSRNLRSQQWCLSSKTPIFARNRRRCGADGDKNPVRVKGTGFGYDFLHLVFAFDFKILR